MTPDDEEFDLFVKEVARPLGRRREDGRAGLAHAPVGEGTQGGAFFSPTLPVARQAGANAALHDVEAFGR